MHSLGVPRAAADRWWVGPGLHMTSVGLLMGGFRLEEASKTVLASTGVIIIEWAQWAPPNGCHQHLCPQKESQLPPASPGGSPRSPGSDPGCFQSTASGLGLRAYEILHAPFKSRVSVSHSPLALWYVNPAHFQSQTFWGLTFLVQNPQAGEPDVGLWPLALWGEPLRSSYFFC